MSLAGGDVVAGRGLLDAIEVQADVGGEPLGAVGDHVVGDRDGEQLHAGTGVDGDRLACQLRPNDQSRVTEGLLGGRVLVEPVGLEVPLHPALVDRIARIDVLGSRDFRLVPRVGLRHGESLPVTRTVEIDVRLEC